MVNSNRDSFMNADYDDPFQPPVGSRQVKCLVCGEKYQSSEIKWDCEAQLWVCRNWPKCSGAGYGISIDDVDPNRPLWS